MTFDYKDLSDFEIRTEPSAWQVQALGKELLVVYASSRSIAGDLMQYDLLFAGRPPVLVPLAFGSSGLFEDSYSCDPRELPANDFDWSTVVGARLAGEPHFWRLDLAGDHTLALYADDVQERNGEHVFTLSVQGGGPPLPVARISSSLISGVRREPLTDEHPDPPLP